MRQRAASAWRLRARERSSAICSPVSAPNSLSSSARRRPLRWLRTAADSDTRSTGGVICSIKRLAAVMGRLTLGAEHARSCRRPARAGVASRAPWRSPRRTGRRSRGSGAAARKKSCSLRSSSASAATISSSSMSGMSSTALLISLTVSAFAAVASRPKRLSLLRGQHRACRNASGRGRAGAPRPDPGRAAAGVRRRDRRPRGGGRLDDEQRAPRVAPPHGRRARAGRHRAARAAGAAALGRRRLAGGDSCPEGRAVRGGKRGTLDGGASSQGPGSRGEPHDRGSLHRARAADAHPIAHGVGRRRRAAAQDARAADHPSVRQRAPSASRCDERAVAGGRHLRHGLDRDAHAGRDRAVGPTP